MLSLNIELSSEKEQAFLNIAKERNTSKEEIIQALIMEFLEDLEDAKIGEVAYKEYLASGKKSISADELFKELGL
ncbi:hypothetical protein KCS59_001038 [Campylobacter jejuni]|uniref:CopG family transcriptional regulator n=3 Tax=Campylobacter TaxID=194 RepID=A0A1E7NLL3_CAMJU|nr:MULTISPECIES: DUF6290 family protein [Campylobacter]AHN82965.1 hypothetical protein 00-2425_00045 [Campylobacter phage CJIE4-3]AHN83023.1 hypothetical protein 00-6200_00045 [Campylobacter phage CJIE4-4]PCM55301.1 hypothetical protein CP502_14335 [Campylobacter sp. BCW_8712]DAH96456.1 MAG TPA: antitoxin [Caudoviricetes sp.]AGV48159.1 hypothetical protein N755_01322 [Campylobacter jejuni subsp. jejuni 00-2544]